MSDNGMYELGTLELRLADADLDLRLSNEVKIATSEKDELDTASRTHDLTGKSFHGDGYWKPWVVKSHGYQLRVDLDIAPELTYDDEAFAQHVAEKLKQSKFWESIGLDATSIETRPNYSRAASWIISLDYSERKVSSERVKVHKLAPELPYHDIKPPPGVRVVKVEAVHVKMLLMNAPAAKALKHASRIQAHVDSGNEDLTFDEENLFCDMDTTSEEQLCRDDGEIISNFDHTQGLTLKSDHEGQQSSDAYLTPPPSQETREERQQQSCTEEKQNMTHRVSTETIMTSLETGLRHAMCKTPSRNSKAHTIISNEDFDCLPAIAPALWAPDYHKSMSDRAVFLPTISHAIANVCKHSSAGSGLKVKAWQLCHRYPHQGKAVLSPGASLSTNEVQEAVSVDLWATMASGLSKTRTANQSRPLRQLFEPTHEADALGDAELMLDEMATDCGSEATCGESDLEDLLDRASEADDMASEADDGSICDLAVGDTGDDCTLITGTEALSGERLPNRWNPEHPSRLDPDLDMFEDSTELHEGEPWGALGSGDGRDGGSFGSHRGSGQCWSGLGLDHDSDVLQCPETARAEPNADDMLLWDLGGFGERSPRRNVEFTMSAKSRDSDGLEEDDGEDEFC